MTRALHSSEDEKNISVTTARQVSSFEIIEFIVRKGRIISRLFPRFFVLLPFSSPGSALIFCYLVNMAIMNANSVVKFAVITSANMFHRATPPLMVLCMLCTCANAKEKTGCFDTSLDNIWMENKHFGIKFLHFFLPSQSNCNFANPS